MKVLREVAVQQRAQDRASAEDEHLRRVRVLRGQSEGGRVLVVNFVNVLVQDARVECLVSCVYLYMVSTKPLRRIDGRVPRKWKKSSKKKKKKICGAIVFSAGNGTWYVCIPRPSAVGWNNQIYITHQTH